MEHPAHTCCRGGDATAFFRAFAFFMGVGGELGTGPRVEKFRLLFRYCSV